MVETVITKYANTQDVGGCHNSEHRHTRWEIQSLQRTQKDKMEYTVEAELRLAEETDGEFTQAVQNMQTSEHKQDRLIDGTGRKRVLDV